MLLGQEPLNKSDVVNLHNWLPTAQDSSADFYHLLWGLVENSIYLDFGFISQFMYWGTHTDYENPFPPKIGTPMRVHITSSSDVAVHLSKEWFQLNALDIEPVGKTLSFCLSSFIRLRDEKVLSSVESPGQSQLSYPQQRLSLQPMRHADSAPSEFSICIQPHDYD